MVEIVVVDNKEASCRSRPYSERIGAAMHKVLMEDASRKSQA